MRFDALLMELNSEEVGRVGTLSKADDYGPMFKSERTVVKDGIRHDLKFMQNRLNAEAASSDAAAYKDSMLARRFVLDLAWKTFKTDEAKFDDGLGFVEYPSNGKTRKVSVGSFLRRIERNFFVVVTHNKYDVAGISVDKGWTSCNDRNGCHRDKPYAEVENGGMAAYLVMGDSKDMDRIMDDHSAGVWRICRAWRDWPYADMRPWPDRDSNS
jgi:hypothetical protein